MQSHVALRLPLTRFIFVMVEIASEVVKEDHVASCLTLGYSHKLEGNLINCAESATSLPSIDNLNL